MSKLTYESLTKTIAEVAASERITKSGLASLSRDCLAFMLGSNGDVRAINALLGTNEDGSFVLTPINHRIACQYFAHFVGFSSNWDDVKEYAIKGQGERVALEFKSKNKRKWAQKVEEIEAWLADERNDLWTWSNNVEMEAKSPDYAKKVQAAVKAAVNPDKGGMAEADLLQVILETEGVSLTAIIESIEAISKQDQAA